MAVNWDDFTPEPSAPQGGVDWNAFTPEPPAAPAPVATVEDGVPGEIAGTINEFRRGLLSGQQMMVAQALDDAPKQLSGSQKYRAFQSAMRSPGYLEALSTAETPQQARKVERAFGPTAALETAQTTLDARRKFLSEDIAKLEREAQSIPSSAAMKEWNDADNGNWFKVLAKNPVEITAGIMAQSFPAMTPALAGQMLAPGGRVAGAVAAGLGSYGVESASAYLDAARNSGFDLSDADRVLEFFNNPQAQAEARQFAVQRGLPIAVFDGITAGVAGKFLGPVLKQSKRTAPAVLKATAAEIALQATGGMAGEAAGQFVSGQELSLKDIVAEGIGELGSGPSEVYSNLRKSRALNKKQAALDELTAAIAANRATERQFNEAQAPAAETTPANVPRYRFRLENGQVLEVSDPDNVGADAVKNIMFRAHRGAEFVEAILPAPDMAEAGDTKNVPATASEVTSPGQSDAIDYSPMDTGGGAVDWNEFTPVEPDEETAPETTETISRTEPTPVVEPSGTPTAAAQPESALPQKPVGETSTTSIHPDAVPIVEFPVADLKLSADVPNFKGGASETTGTVTGQELTGKYQRTGTAPIVAWQRLNGDVEVITGRHRLDLARRTGEKTIPTQIVREADGFTKDMALTFDAEANIRDGQGEVGDYATYFKGTNISEAEARARGLLSRTKGKAGWSLAKAASDDVYALWRDNKISEPQAVAIANAAPGDAAAQQIGSKFALQGKSADFISNVIKASRAEAGQRAQALDLFGNDDSAMQQMAEQAKRATAFQQEIAEQIRAVQGAAKRPEVARKLGVDVTDPEGINQKIVQLKNELARWQSWPMHPDLAAKAKGLPPAAMSLAQSLDAKINKLTDKRNAGQVLTVPEEAQLRALEAQRGQRDLLADSELDNNSVARRAIRLRQEAADLFLRADAEQLRAWSSVHRQDEYIGNARAYRQEAARRVQTAEQLERTLSPSQASAESPLLPAKQQEPQLDLFSLQSTVNQPEAPGTAVADVLQVAAAEASDVPVRVVHDPALTDNGQMVEGYLDASTGQVVLNAAAPSMRDPANARQVTREERGHWLLNTAEGQGEQARFAGRLTPEQRAELQRMGYRRQTGESAEQFEARLHNEFIAKQARDNTAWWKRYVQHIADWVRGHKGLKAITNEEVARGILRRLNAAQAARQISHGYLVTGNGVLVAPWARMKEVQASLRAHHGTPHEVDRFSTRYIGAGEAGRSLAAAAAGDNPGGVYGWGLYFAENPAVSSTYRRAGNTGYEVNGKTVKVPMWGEMGGDEITAEQYAAKADWSSTNPLFELRDRKMFPNEAKALEAARLLTEGKVKQSTGNEYTVDLDVKPEELLDWDKPLSEQSEKVKSVLAAMDFPVMNNQGARQGKGLFYYPVNALEAAEFSKAGIKGIRYLDQGSRLEIKAPQFTGDAWEALQNGKLVAKDHDKARFDAAVSKLQTYNYVIFDESVIRITHKNGQAVSPQQQFGSVPQFSLSPVTPVSPATQTQVDVIESQVPGVNVSPATAAPPGPVLRSALRDGLGTQSGKVIYYGSAALLNAKRGIDLTAAYQGAAVKRQSDDLMASLFAGARDAQTGWKLPQWMKLGAWATRTRAFKKRVLHIASRLNATGRNADGSFAFTDFKARAGLMTLGAFKAGKHAVGDVFVHTDPKTGVSETIEIGPFVQAPDGRAGHQLFRALEAGTQAELYRATAESYPEMMWLLDMFIDPALAHLRQTINGVEIPVFNRFASAAMMAAGDPNFTPLTGYTPDVLVSRSLVGAIRGALSFSAGTRSPGRKYKFGSSRESGNVRDLLTGFNVRTFQMLQEQARRDWRAAVFRAGTAIPKSGVPAGWVKLETGMEDLFDAARRLRQWTSPVDAAGNVLYPETERRMSDDGSDEFKAFWKEIYALRGRQLMIPAPLVEALKTSYSMQRQHNALYRLAAWGLRNSTQLFLAMPKTYVSNVLTNDLFTAEAATMFALRGVMTANARDLRFARNLFSGTFTNRFAAFRQGTGLFDKTDFMQAIREALPDQLFSDSTSLADVKVRWGNSAWDYLAQGEIGGAALQLIQYGQIDVRAKQRMAFAFLKANAVSNARRAGLTGTALKAAVQSYLANPPAQDRIQAVEIANFELLNYADSPQMLNDFAQNDFSKLVLPFPRFGYHYVTKQAKRVAAARNLVGTVPKGKRAEAFASLVTVGLYGFGGAGALGLALAGAFGGDDDDDARKLVGASTVPKLNPDGSVSLKPVDREFVTANRLNITAWARAMGLDTDNENDFWLRVRNYPTLAAAGVTALAYNDAKKYGAMTGALQFASGATDLATDFFSVGAAVKVPAKLLTEAMSIGKPGVATSPVDPFATGVPVSFYVTEQLTDSFIPGSRQADELIAWIDPIRPRRTASKSLDYAPGVAEALQASHLTGLLTRIARGGDSGLQPAGRIDRRSGVVLDPSTITLTERISSLGGFNLKAIPRNEFEAALRQ